MPKRKKSASKVDNNTLAGYGLVLLEQSNRIHSLERILHQMLGSSNEMALATNKINAELANKIQTLETKLAEVEKLIVHKSKSVANLKLAGDSPLDS